MIGLVFERVGNRLTTNYCVMDDQTKSIIESGTITSQVNDLIDCELTRRDITDSLSDRFKMQILIEDYGLVDSFKTEHDIKFIM